MRTYSKTPERPFLTKTSQAAAMIAAASLLASNALAQCPAPEFATGLQGPLSLVLTNKGNILASESGSSTANTGRISIIGPDGKRRTFLDGLPSGPSAEGENQPSGPSGLFLSGRTLYLAIGVGDSVLLGPNPGTAKPNPNPSSPLFSSVLAIHFSANVEKTTRGFVLTMADQQTLAGGKSVQLTNGSGDKITIDLVVNFPDYTAEPRPDYPDNVRNSNPFGLARVGNKLYVSNGGQNLVHQVDLATGAFSVLSSFPPVPNPAFNPNDPRTGGPTLDAVPTGIRYVDGKLLVALFRGYPFVAGTSEVVQVDPQDGSYASFITGLKTAIDVRPITPDAGDGTQYLVLQHASDPQLTPPGVLLRYDKPAGPAATVVNCLVFPTAMIVDDRTGTLYLAQLTGSIATIPINSEAYRSEAGLAPNLLNISTRGRVGTGDDVLIGGFIVGSGVGGGNSRVVVRAIGPSLVEPGVIGVLADPVLELRNPDGSLLASNDNWKDSQKTELEATGLAPKNDVESAIVQRLAPGNYTAIVRGANESAGVALVEVYNLSN